VCPVPAQTLESAQATCSQTSVPFRIQAKFLKNFPDPSRPPIRKPKALPESNREVPKGPNVPSAVQESLGTGPANPKKVPPNQPVVTGSGNNNQEYQGPVRPCSICVPKHTHTHQYLSSVVCLLTGACLCLMSN